MVQGRLSLSHSSVDNQNGRVVPCPTNVDVFHDTIGDTWPTSCLTLPRGDYSKLSYYALLRPYYAPNYVPFGVSTHNFLSFAPYRNPRSGKVTIANPAPRGVLDQSDSPCCKNSILERKNQGLAPPSQLLFRFGNPSLLWSDEHFRKQPNNTEHPTFRNKYPPVSVCRDGRA